MELKITKNLLFTVLASFAVGMSAGAIGNHLYSVSHTPEDKLQELRDAKSALEFTRNQSAQEALNASNELRKLKATKYEYQNEIRPELEAKIRKELQTYISQAEVSYKKAEELKKEAEVAREIASLKLELAKTLNESVTHTEKETKIIVKAVDDAEAELK